MSGGEVPLTDSGERTGWGGNLCQMKKVVTADRGREKVFIHPKRTNVKRWERTGEDRCTVQEQ